MNDSQISMSSMQGIGTGMEPLMADPRTHFLLTQMETALSMESK